MESLVLQCESLLVGMSSLLKQSIFFYILLGEFDTENREEEEEFRATYVVHPQYKNNNGKSLIYDFALLRLEREVSFRPEISPACLPSESRRLEGAAGVVIGWGNQRLQNTPVGVEGLVKGYGYQLSTILQELDVRSQYKLLPCELT